MVKAGYKQTEVGEIPGDWDVKPLKRISPSQSVGLVINPSTYYDDDGSIPMLVGSQIYENYIDWESAKRISESSNNLLPASRLSAGDLVTIRVGDPGVTAVVPPWLDGCNCASMMIVRQHPSFDSNWLCFLMNSRLGRSQIEHVQYGTAQKQFNISDAVNFLYPVPPLPEQRAIAEVLSDVDGLIAGLDKLIAKKRAVKQAAMQQLLTGKTRLPGFGNGVGLKITEIGELADDWELFEVSQTMQLGRGGSPRPIQAYLTQKEDGINWIKIGDVGIGAKYIDNTQEKIKPEGEYFSRKVLPGDLLLSNSMSFGRPYITRIPGCVHDGWLVLQNYDENFETEFLYYLLSSNQILNQYRQKASGSSVLNLNKELVATVLLPKPSLQEQKAIAEVCSDMDAETTALEARRAKTQVIKQGMMQELLTGRTRLL
jgi:type I restriction enzyme S subunit